jgi:hypothetical protein
VDSFNDRVGFAEVIRQELCAYGIQIHAYFPSTLLTPGHEAEVNIHMNLLY